MSMSTENMMDYIVKNPRRMLTISMMLLLVFISVIAYNYATTGDVVEKSIDFKSGTQAQIEFSGTVDVSEAERVIQDRYGSGTNVRVLTGMTQSLIIETDSVVSEAELDAIASELGIEVTGRSTQSIGAALGDAFFRQALTAVVIAFISMAIVVFVTFKNFVPSVAVILAGVSDMIAAMAGMDIFGIQLSMGTLAGLLILMGYSIDTDILLSTRVLKRKSEGALDDRIKSSMRTGITMSFTSIISMVILLMVSSSPALDGIASVIIMGLVADIPFTWLQNVGILKLYLMDKTERKKK